MVALAECHRLSHYVERKAALDLARFEAGAFMAALRSSPERHYRMLAAVLHIEPVIARSILDRFVKSVAVLDWRSEAQGGSRRRLGVSGSSDTIFRF